MCKLVMLALISTGISFASERMSVSICNLARLPGSVLTRAETEAAAIFAASDVQIEWRSCDERPTNGQAGVNWFTIRLRDYEADGMASPRALEAMGKAFLLSDLGNGYLADCYYGRIQDLARLRQADASLLLGQVIAHELGHFLLGPGHSRNSIMRAEWTIDKRAGLRQQWLRFSVPQGRQIRHKLRMQGAHLLLVASR